MRGTSRRCLVFVACCALVALLSGCGSGSRDTTILVIIESDLVVPDQVDAVRVEAVGPHERSSTTEALVEPFPRSVIVRPGRNEQDAEVQISVTALLRERAVVTYGFGAQFREGEQVEVTIWLGPCPSCVDAGATEDAEPGGDGSAGDAGPTADWLPSNVPADLVPDPGARVDLRVEGVVTCDTDTGAIDAAGVEIRPAGEGVIAGIGFSVVSQPEGPELAVLSLGGIEVGDGATLRMSGSRAAVLLATDAVRIDGRIDAGAQLETAGPGGGSGGTAAVSPATGDGAGGAGTEAADSTVDGGGGGGGFGGTGGAAGEPAGTVGAGEGGVAYGEPALSPLRGGSGGGFGCWSPGRPISVRGGAGGGALQIFSAVSIAVSAEGVVEAGGAGGGGAPALDVDVTGPGVGAGGGGGSGGGILLEAPVITIAGAVAANGGGGGAGGSELGGAAGDGEDGGDGATPAAGGEPSGDDGGRGGQGGTAGAPDGATGGPGEDSGGGGGAAGRIRLNTATGAATLPGVLSPVPSQGVLRSAPRE